MASTLLELMEMKPANDNGVVNPEELRIRAQRAEFLLLSICAVCSIIFFSSDTLGEKLTQYIGEDVANLVSNKWGIAGVSSFFLWRSLSEVIARNNDYNPYRSENTGS